MITTKDTQKDQKKGDSQQSQLQDEPANSKSSSGYEILSKENIILETPLAFKPSGPISGYKSPWDFIQCVGIKLLNSISIVYASSL